MAEFTHVVTQTVNCPACGNSWVIKHGKQNHQQRYLCRKCKKKFRANGKAPGRTQPTDIIGGAIRDYYMGMSYKQIAEGLKQRYGIPQPSKRTVYQWVTDFTAHAIKTLQPLKANTGDQWLVDEMMVQVGGKNLWLWNVMDSRTRYALVSHLSTNRRAETAVIVMKKALAASRNAPQTIKSDGHASYPPAIESIMPRTHHIVSKGIRARINNNRLERLNSTYRSRTKTLRGLDSIETGQKYLDGYRLTYNFFREHEGIGYDMPGRLARVEFPFHKWGEVVASATKRTTPVKPSNREKEPFSQGHFRLRSRPRSGTTWHKTHPRASLPKSQPQADPRFGRVPVGGQTSFSLNPPLPKREGRTPKGAPKPELPSGAKQTHFKLPGLPHPAVATVEKTRKPRIKPRPRGRQRR